MGDIAGAGAQLTIDLAAVRRNYHLLAAQVGQGVTAAAVVKADAYGLGAARIAPALDAEGCATFFVATLDEGIALRGHLPAPASVIYVLNGPVSGSEPEFRRHDVRPVLNDLGQIDRWAAAARAAGSASWSAAIHVDTGMARLGLPADEVAALRDQPARAAGLDLALLLSHLACAEQDTHPMNKQQRTRFVDLRRDFAAAIQTDSRASFANSSGIFLGPDFHFDMVRPGAALYGVNPQPDRSNPMAQVIHLQGKIAQVRDVDSPMTVGYGAAHRVTGRGRIATVPVGYADGYLRSLSNRGIAAIAGHSVPVVGRVSMDLTTIDVSGLPDDLVGVGTPVTLIGDGVPLDDVATAAGTIGYEILTRLGARVPRRYLDPSEA